MTRILIIEDEGSYREALTFMLGKEGFDVAAAADGESGLAEYERNGYVSALEKAKTTYGSLR